MRKLLKLFSNLYFLATLIMLVWLLFFDRYNFGRRFNDRQDLARLKDERAYYELKTEEAKKNYDELFSNEEKLEKFARERYFMKKENEEVYVVE